MKKKLKIDLDEIAVLMEDQMDMSGSFLNTETGEIVYIPEELLGERCFDEDYVATYQAGNKNWQSKQGM